jgi:prepilin-type N-terminal cleavage/methylation domain-containing protein
MKKMNNKGFSLVELIVVVLIMAIIAVALAPQVMRWVENSRKSNDIEAYGSLVNAIQVAGTDEAVLKQIKEKKEITFTASGVGGLEGALLTAVQRTLPELKDSKSMKVQGDWSNSPAVCNSGNFKITVTKAADGSGLAVEQTNRPLKVFS